MESLGSGEADDNTENYASSEEEDDLNDENILQSMLRSFQGTGVGEKIIYGLYKSFEYFS